ncbi:hypothetical protein VTG60DRAFT_6435 [Thermothelomyces hinnuleus]
MWLPTTYKPPKDRTDDAIACLEWVKGSLAQVDNPHNGGAMVDFAMQEPTASGHEPAQYGHSNYQFNQPGDQQLEGLHLPPAGRLVERASAGQPQPPV